MDRPSQAKGSKPKKQQQSCGKTGVVQQESEVFLTQMLKKGFYVEPRRNLPNPQIYAQTSTTFTSKSKPLTSSRPGGPGPILFGQEPKRLGADSLLPFIKQEPADETEESPPPQIVRTHLSFAEPRENILNPKTRVIKVLSSNLQRAPTVGCQAAASGPQAQTTAAGFDFILKSIKQEPIDDYNCSSQVTVSEGQPPMGPGTPVYCLPLGQPLKITQAVKEREVKGERRRRGGGGRRGAGGGQPPGRPGRRPPSAAPAPPAPRERPERAESAEMRRKIQALFRPQAPAQEAQQVREEALEYRSSEGGAACRRPWARPPFETLSIPESASDSLLADLDPEAFERIHPAVRLDRRALSLLLAAAAASSHNLNPKKSLFNPSSCLMADEDPMLTDTDKYIFKPTPYEVKPPKRAYRKRVSKTSINVEDLKTKSNSSHVEVRQKLETATQHQFTWKGALVE